MRNMKIAVLITSHNRKSKTISCLEELFKCALPAGAKLRVFLVDDGSTDGTGTAVKDSYPQVDVIEGDGNLYWSGGMRLAFAAAIKHKFDYYLWLNDDTYLYPLAIEKLLRVVNDCQISKKKTPIVVGSTQEKIGTLVNHGGIVKWSRLNSKLVEPQDVPIPCETMYGNCVLIPHDIVNKVGNLDEIFVHSIGDVDYGLRAKRAGFNILVMPGFAGTCESNHIKGTLSDKNLPLAVRLKMMLGPKGLPPKPWLIFLWRHRGFKGLLYWFYSYMAVILTWHRRRFTKS